MPARPGHRPPALEHDREGRGELIEALFVARVETFATRFVQQLRDGKDLAGLAPQRHAKNVAGSESGFAVDFAIEPLIGVRIGDVDRLTRRRDVPNDALSDLHTNFERLALFVSRDLSPHLAGLGVDEEKGTALGREKLPDSDRQRLQNL